MTATGGFQKTALSDLHYSTAIRVRERLPSSMLLLSYLPTYHQYVAASHPVSSFLMPLPLTSLSFSPSPSPSHSLRLCLTLSISLFPSHYFHLTLSISPSQSHPLNLTLSISPSQSHPLNLTLSISPSQSHPLNLTEGEIERVRLRG